jgi:GntR family transcriptional regulator
VPQHPYRAEPASEAIGADIARGTYLPGTRLPSRKALAERYEVNPRTVTAALRILADQGRVILDEDGFATVAKIRRHPGDQNIFIEGKFRGWHVAAARIGLRRWDKVISLGDVRAGSQVAHYLRVPPGSMVFERARLHGVYDDADREVPVQRSWSWYHPDVMEKVPRIREPDTGHGGSWARFQDAGWQPVGDEIIGAVNATAEDAAALKVRKGKALTEAWRLCSDEATGRPLEILLRLINPDAHELAFP